MCAKPLSVRRRSYDQDLQIDLATAAEILSLMLKERIS